MPIPVENLVNANSNKYFMITEKNLTKCKIWIKQETGEYSYSIKIAGNVVFEIINTHAEVFNDVKVYTSDNFWAPPTVYIKLLEITTKEGEKNMCLCLNYKYSLFIG